MRIYIIGPTGSGKTWLAQKLSQHYHIKHINLDYVLYTHITDKSRTELSEDEWMESLRTEMQQENWIIEGINPINEVFNAADKVIYLRVSLLYSLLNQWKRYLTSPAQRKEHGFINNIKLSQYVIKQHREEYLAEGIDNPKYFRISKMDKIIERYKSKVMTLTSKKEITELGDKELPLRRITFL